MKRLYVKLIGNCTPSCREMAHLSSQSLDRKLCFWEKIRMNMHGWICSWCKDYSQQVQHISGTVQGEGESLAELKGDEMSDESKDKLKAMMAQSLAEEKDQGR